MVSGLFSAKTVAHLSAAPATASFEHAVAVCTETPALNTSTMALIPRRVCIIFSLFDDITNISSLPFFRPGPKPKPDWQDIELRGISKPPRAAWQDASRHIRFDSGRRVLHVIEHVVALAFLPPFRQSLP